MVTTQLIQVLTFTNVGIGAQATLPHNLNINGLRVKPDIVQRDNGDFSIVAITATQATVQNDGADIATLNLWLERKHSIERAIGAGVANLTPQPFVPASGGGGSSGGGGGFIQYQLLGDDVDPNTLGVDFALPPSPTIASGFSGRIETVTVSGAREVGRITVARLFWQFGAQNAGTLTIKCLINGVAQLPTLAIIAVTANPVVTTAFAGLALADGDTLGFTADMSADLDMSGLLSVSLIAEVL